MKEIWKDVVGYEGAYMCSNKGRFKRLKDVIFVIDEKQKRQYYKTIKQKMLKQFKDCNGYYVVNIDGKRMRAHRLLSKSFIPNPLNKAQVNHKDLDKSNNNINNLEWVTPKENVKHAIRNGAFKNVKAIKNAVYMCDLKTHKLLKKFDSVTEAYNYFGKNYQGGISQVCNGERNKTKGYWWTYEKDKTK